MTQYEAIVWQGLSASSDRQCTRVANICVAYQRNARSNNEITRNVGSYGRVSVAANRVLTRWLNKMARQPPSQHARETRRELSSREIRAILLLTAWLIKGRRHTCVCKFLVQLQTHLARILERRNNSNVFLTSLMGEKCERWLPPGPRGFDRSRDPSLHMPMT